MYKLDCKVPKSYPKPEIVWLYTSLSDPSASRNILDRRITVSPDGDLYFTNVTKEVIFDFPLHRLKLTEHLNNLFCA